MRVVRYITKEVEEWATKNGYNAFTLVHPMFQRVILLKCEKPMERKAWGVTKEEPFVIINPDMAWIYDKQNPYEPKFKRNKEKK